MIVLELPLPPSPNKRQAHPIAEQRAKNEYRQRAWFRAIGQEMPKAVEDLPSRVRVRAELYLPRRRDDDNAAFALKWPLDTLKARQLGSMRWRQGAYTEKGYLVDDDGEHCEVVGVTQHTDRKHPRIVLYLEAA